MITDQVMDFWNDLESLEVAEKSNILVKMFKTLIKLAFNYLTFWVLIFHALYYIGVAKQFQASLLLLSFIISLNGFVIVYYYPKKFSIPYLNINATGGGLYNTYIADFVLHQIPLIFLLLNYDNKIKPDSLALGIIIGALYIITQNYEKVYNLKCRGCKQTHRGDNVLTKRCLITCGLFNIEIIILLALLLLTLIRQLLKR